MRIYPYSSHGELNFVVEAENDADLALLTMFTSERWRKGKEFRMGGHTWRDGATRSFNFGWAEPFDVKTDNENSDQS